MMKFCLLSPVVFSFLLASDNKSLLQEQIVNPSYNPFNYRVENVRLGLPYG